jgi:hypothetical protein
MRTRAQQIVDEQLKEDVLAGLAVLKEQYGDGWVEKIDCKTLDLTSGSACVLGQVCGDFGEGVVAIHGHPDDDWAKEHGFFARNEDDEDNDTWSELDSAWHYVLCDSDGEPCSS